MKNVGVHGAPGIGLFRRVLTGDGHRRTRLHTYKGHWIDPAGLAYLPHCLWSVLLLKCFDHRQHIPWLGFRVVRRLQRLMGPDWRVLEFGSGMSSLFFARSCAQLVSIEHDPLWYERMRSEFRQSRLRNVDYRLRDGDNYTELADLPDASFDLVLIDGIRRDQAALTAVRKCRPGGWILLDNSDVGWPEHQSARAFLVAAGWAGNVEVYDDLYPFGLQACESILVRMPEKVLEA